MKIYIGTACVFSTRYETWDKLNTEYRRAENAQGRTVPQYAWEAYAIVLARWLLKKAMDELWKIAVAYKKNHDAQERPPASEQREEQRHQELMEKLDRLAEISAGKIQPKGESDKVIDIIEAARLSGSAVTIEFETDAEQDLEEPLKKALAALPPGQVSIRKPTT